MRRRGRAPANAWLGLGGTEEEVIDHHPRGISGGPSGYLGWTLGVSREGARSPKAPRAGAATAMELSMFLSEELISVNPLTLAVWLRRYHSLTYRGKIAIDYRTQGNPRSTLSSSDRRRFRDVDTAYGRTLTDPLRFNAWGTREMGLRDARARLCRGDTSEARFEHVLCRLRQI